MAKSACLLALLFVVVVFCAEAVRIDPPPVHVRPKKQFAFMIVGDQRCAGKPNGQYPLPDCRKYIKCSDGNGREMVCPNDWKFDSIAKTCDFPDKAVCGKTGHSGPLDVDVTCPSKYGYFPYTADCHKYIVCDDGRPTVKECNPNTYYNDVNGGCVPGDCGQQYSDDKSVCKKENGKYPHSKDCKKYIECHNWLPHVRHCAPGKAFDTQKNRCTKEQLKKCKTNEIWSIGQDDE